MELKLRMLWIFVLYLLPVLLISPRFVYLIAALCSLYLSVAPFLSSFHSPITFSRIALWIGTVLLLIAAVSPSNRKSNMTALVGSTVTALLLVYGISRFVAFRLGYVHAKGQLGAYRPNTFDRVNQISTAQYWKPVWEGGLRVRGKYLATVDCATAIPNLSSSP